MPTKKATKKELISAIANGPDALEIFLLDKYSIDTSADPLERYQLLIDFTQKSASFSQVLREFILGHFHYLASIHSQENTTSKNLLSVALENYQKAVNLDGSKKIHTFYARLLIGNIMQMLEYPWPQVEEAFLAAHELDPSRGEPSEAIIRHYLSQCEWAIAYIFTSYSIDSFFEKPSKNMKWGFNASFYSWKILDLHTAACFQLGLEVEAQQTFNRLVTLTEKEPHRFSIGDIDKINTKKQLFKSPIPTC